MSTFSIDSYATQVVSYSTRNLLLYLLPPNYLWNLQVTAYFHTLQVAGLNYSLHGTVNGTIKVHVRAFKPLPHTGAPIEITGAELVSSD